MGNTSNQSTLDVQWDGRNWLLREKWETCLQLNFIWNYLYYHTVKYLTSSSQLCGFTSLLSSGPSFSWLSLELIISICLGHFCLLWAKVFHWNVNFIYRVFFLMQTSYCLWEKKKKISWDAAHVTSNGLKLVCPVQMSCPCCLSSGGTDGGFCLQITSSCGWVGKMKWDPFRSACISGGNSNSNSNSNLLLHKQSCWEECHPMRRESDHFASVQQTRPHNTHSIWASLSPAEQKQWDLLVEIEGKKISAYGHEHIQEQCIKGSFFQSFIASLKCESNWEKSSRLFCCPVTFEIIPS